MNILVSGATGLIGKSVCASLINEGHKITVLSRGPKKAGNSSSISALRWDPVAGSPPPEAWNGIDAAIHLAGEPVAAARWTDTQKRKIRDSRVIGTRNLVDGIRKSGSRPKVLISASAVGYYGDRGDEMLTEDSAAGKGFLSEVCVEWEAEALASRDSGVRVVMLRIGVVLSPTGGAMEKMLTPFKLGLGGRMGSGRQWFPWIHIDDSAGILRHALVTDSVSGAINAVAPGIVTNEEFARELGAVLNRPAILPVPEFALQIMMGEMAEVVLSSQRISPKVALDTGYEFRYPDLTGALNALLK